MRSSLGVPAGDCRRERVRSCHRRSRTRSRGRRWVAIPGLGGLGFGIDESSLFAAGGGTETDRPDPGDPGGVPRCWPAAIVAGRQGDRQRSAYVRLLAGRARSPASPSLIAVLDQWTTGEGPHYGALKFTFLTAIVAARRCCLPVGLLLLDPARLPA